MEWKRRPWTTKLHPLFHLVRPDTYDDGKRFYCGGRQTGLSLTIETWELEGHEDVCSQCRRNYQARMERLKEGELSEERHIARGSRNVQDVRIEIKSGLHPTGGWWAECALRPYVKAPAFVSKFSGATTRLQAILRGVELAFQKKEDADEHRTDRTTSGNGGERD